MPGGRPKAPEVIPPQFGVIVNASSKSLVAKAKEVALRLPDSDHQTIGLLVKATLDFEINMGVQEHAPLVKRKKQGRRPEFALQQLLIDCATIHQELTGEHPLDTLGMLSSGRDGGPEDTGDLYRHAVIRYAGTVLSVLGVEHEAGWRRQLRSAFEAYKAQHPEV